MLLGLMPMTPLNRSGCSAIFPLLAYAISPKTKGDEDKLATALHRLLDEAGVPAAVRNLDSWLLLAVAGLLGATLSSALSSLVGSARILQAMGEHRVLPRGEWLSFLTDKGEPRHAMMVTGGIVGATLSRYKAATQ